MVDSESSEGPLVICSYQKLLDDLHAWKNSLATQIGQMHDDVLIDMNRAYENIYRFSSLADKLLLDQERELSNAKSMEEIDIIEQRINIILAEVQFIKSLSFQLNSDAVKFNDNLQINYHNHDIKSNFSILSILPYYAQTWQTISPESITDHLPYYRKYRFLISRADAIELETHNLSDFHLTSNSNELIQECVLTFNFCDLDMFLKAFTTYWNILPNHNNELRILVPKYDVPFLMGKLNEASHSLIQRFQLEEIKFYPHSCPKSDERILIINGKQRHLIQDCIEEIYFNLNQYNKSNELEKRPIKYYEPDRLSNEEIKIIKISNVDYGGFMNIDPTSIHSSDDDVWTVRESCAAIIEREMIVNDKQADLIVGINASNIERIRRETGASVYVKDDGSDIKRIAVIKGTRQQVNQAYEFIENPLERYVDDELILKQESIQKA